MTLYDRAMNLCGNLHPQVAQAAVLLEISKLVRAYVDTHGYPLANGEHPACELVDKVDDLLLALESADKWPAAGTPTL